MKTISVKYNPFTVSTEIRIDGEIIDKNSILYKVCENYRLQEWIEPHRSKEDFFTVLKRTINDKHVKIEFYGTTLDFEDLIYGKEQYGDIFENIEIIHKQKSSSGTERIEDLKLIYKKLMAGPIESLKDTSIQNAFKDAINPEFQIVIVAPMSSGKSTLINALMGEDLLPAINQATTAKITRIKDNNDARKFRVTWKIKDTIYTEEASLELINKLNSDKNVKEILIEGNIPSVNSTKIKLVFVDTPGGNNSQDESHKEIMEKAINSENNSVILYVFNGTTPTTNDGNSILTMISNAMKISANGKQSRDRFLFVANKMDEVDVDKESYESMIETIKDELGKDEIGISDPKLFLVSALPAKILRLAKKQINLTESEHANLMIAKMRFNDQRRMLSQYASISELTKKSLMDEANENMVPMMEAILPQNKDRAEKAAEINTGIPALELAIKEYLDKYAISIKVKSAHDTFVRKADVFKMMTNYEEICASSEEAYNENLNELYIKTQELEKSNKRKEFLDRINNIKFDRNSTYDKLIEPLEKMQSMGGNNTELIDKYNARKILDDFKVQNEKQILKIMEAIDQDLREDKMKKCNDIVDEYKDYIRELDNSGLLNIGEFSIMETEAFNNILESINNISITNEYIEIIDVKTGEKKYKKSGITNAIRRLFNNESGWGTTDIFEKKDFVRIDELIINAMSEIRYEIIECVQEILEVTDKSLARIKESANVTLSNIDNVVLEQYNELKEKTNDIEKLKKQVQLNKENLTWLKEFIADMDMILEV